MKRKKLVIFILPTVFYLLLMLYFSNSIRYGSQYTHVGDHEKQETFLERCSIGSHLTNQSTNANECPYDKCEVIHLAIVCTKFDATRNFVTLLKSILFYRKNPLHFHFISDVSATKILKVLFQTWLFPAVEVTFYPFEELKKGLEWIPNRHYSGMNGVIKLRVTDRLDPHIDKVITLDTDIQFVTDVANLWNMFRSFGKNQAIGMVAQQSDWYSVATRPGQQIWPHKDEGYNNGVTLLDIKLLKSLKWNLMWVEVTKRTLKSLHFISLGEQDIINAVIKENPNLLYKLPCWWNIQLQGNPIAEQCYMKSSHVKVMHWNSPNKMEKKFRYSEYFYNLYLFFFNLNGDHLREKFPIICKPQQNSSSPPSPSSQSFLLGTYFNKSTLNAMATKNRQCYAILKEKLIDRRIHLYYLSYSEELISSALPKPTDVDVTLVTQLSTDQLQMLERVASMWKGPISLAIYTKDAEIRQFLTFVQGSTILSSRRNIGYHVVYKTEHQYHPINYLRNVALGQVNTKFAFLTDVDFLPVVDMYEKIKGHIISLDLVNKTKALVIPIFESYRYETKYPNSKSELLAKLQSGELSTYGYQSWPRGQAATQYSKWKNASEAYQVSYESYYEPFIVIDRSASDFDDIFGLNRTLYIMGIYTRGYEFWVVPDCFMVHLHHSINHRSIQYGYSDSYRECLRLVEEDLLRDLSKRNVTSKL